MQKWLTKLCGPATMSLDVTYKCTLRCLHCFNMSGEQDFNKSELSDDELTNLSEQIGNMRPTVICMCGGEPLLRIDILKKCSEIIKENSEGMTQVNMVTNGELMTESLAKELKLANFTSIQVSLDGANNKTHDWLRNKDGVFNKAIKAIEYLKKAELHVGVACTPTLKNIEEIDSILKLCEDLGVNNFRMQPLMPLGRAIDRLRGYIPTHKDYRNIANKLLKTKYENVAFEKMAVEWGDPVDHLIRFRQVLKGNNLSIGINAYGDITISPYIPVTLGNIKKYSLEEYWNKGLLDAWDIPLIGYFADRMLSCDSLCINSIYSELPLIYRDEGIALDIIEDDVFNISVEEILMNKIRS